MFNNYLLFYVLISKLLESKTQMSFANLQIAIYDNYTLLKGL